MRCITPPFRKKKLEKNFKINRENGKYPQNKRTDNRQLG